MNRKMAPAGTPIGLGLPTSGSLVVLDLEYTAWEGSKSRGWSGPDEHREIVQIGAVRLDAGAGLAEMAALSRLVLPRLNPQLSDYFTALTGIDGARLGSEGMASDAALAEAAAFAEGAVIVSHGRDQDVVFETCALHGIADPFAGSVWLDLAPPIRSVTGRPAMSSELPAILGLGPIGGAHDALADARALAVVLRHFRERGLS